MQHFVGYHSTEKWGEWTAARKGELGAFFTAKQYRGDTLKGNCLWAIVGTGSPKRYQLVSFGLIERIAKCRRPAPYRGFGKSVSFRVHRTRLDVTELQWFKALKKEQQGFRYGLNRITNRGVISELEKLMTGTVDGIPQRLKASGKRIGYSVAEISDVEGTMAETLITRRGRSQRLRQAALQRAAGICSVCRRDFQQLLQGRGVRVLQVHHTAQLSASKSPRITKLTDLVVVCANCHLLIHLNPRRALRPSTLRKMLRPGFLKGSSRRSSVQVDS